MAMDSKERIAGMTLTSSEAYEIANQLALASSSLLKFRLDNQRTLTLENALLLEKCEDELDSHVVTYRNKGITLLGEESASAVSEIKSATAHATKFLKTLESIDNAIKIATCMIDLTRALSTRDARGVVLASKEMKKAVAPA